MRLKHATRRTSTRWSGAALPSPARGQARRRTSHRRRRSLPGGPRRHVDARSWRRRACARARVPARPERRRHELIGDSGTARRGRRARSVLDARPFVLTRPASRCGADHRRSAGRRRSPRSGRRTRRARERGDLDGALERRRPSSARDFSGAGEALHQSALGSPRAAVRGRAAAARTSRDDARAARHHGPAAAARRDLQTRNTRMDVAAFDVLRWRKVQAEQEKKNRNEEEREKLLRP